MRMACWLVRIPGKEPVAVGNELSIGRASTCGLSVNDNGVSRVHCRLVTKASQLMLYDESRNGTSVNGIRIQNRAMALALGDILEVGPLRLMVDEASDVVLPAKVLSPPLMRRAPTPTVVPPAVPSNVRSFQVEVIEQESGSRYRDAVRLPDGSVLVLMTDFVSGPASDASAVHSKMVAWKAAVRDVAPRTPSPDAVLQTLNQALFADGMTASASCARLDPRDGLLTVACAGAPAPWVLRCHARPVHVQAEPCVPLGRVRGAQFATRALHFGSGDTLLLASTAWTAALGAALGDDRTNPRDVTNWVRQQAPSTNASLIRLTLE